MPIALPIIWALMPDPLHIAHTRVSTRNLAALSRRGLSQEAILALYPSLSSRNVEEALALEVQLERNLHPAAA